jgi:SEC-C motif
MKIGRNDQCPCCSGKKYKHCHYRKPFSPDRDLSVHARNRILLRAAEDIFGFRRGRSWNDFKKNISGEEIRSFYELQASLSRPTTDWAAIMPPPTAGLRGLYLGGIRPEYVLQNLVRFSLYSDELFVINPVHNPWLLKPEFNPIDNPNQFKADTIRVLYFLFQTAPWIESGIVQLIPDPGDFNLALKRETFRLAMERRADKELHPSDREEAHSQGHKELRRVFLALPEDELIRQIERSGQTLTDQAKKNVVEYARRELHNDPLALEQSIMTGDNSQLMTVRAGTNLETALMISGLTGAFLYTNMAGRWEDIVSAHDEMSETARVWSPFANAFQSLQFRFLNNVDVGFANKLREDGRLEAFRSLLRKIGKDTTVITDLGALEMYVRDCKDELTGEYQKAQAEWSKIDEDFLKWAGTGAAAAAIGHLVPNVSALAGAVANTLVQLGLRHFRQRQFRKANPMSVFIDLSRKETPGGVTLI